MTISERTALQLLVAVYELEAHAETEARALVDTVAPSEKRAAVEALQHMRSGYDETIARLRSHVMTTWNHRPPVEQIATETQSIEPDDIPRPWDRDRNEDNLLPRLDPPEVVDLGAGVDNDGGHGETTRHGFD